MGQKGENDMGYKKKKRKHKVTPLQKAARKWSHQEDIRKRDAKIALAQKLRPKDALIERMMEERRALESEPQPLFILKRKAKKPSRPPKKGKAKPAPRRSFFRPVAPLHLSDEEFLARGFDPEYIAGDFRAPVSKMEDRVAKILDDCGFKGRYTRQKPVSYYYADFYFPALKLVLEFDGPIHDGEKKQRKDAARTVMIERAGHRVVRLHHSKLKRGLMVELKLWLIENIR